MKNLNLLLLGAAAIGGFYLFNKSKEKELASSAIEEELDALEEQVAQNETDIITNTGRIVEQELSLQSALDGQISIDDIDLSGVYTKDEVTNLLNQKANSIDVYTKADIDSKLLDKVNTGNVYDKSEIDTKLLEKANSIDVYTKGDIDTNFYSKTEADNLLQGKQNADNYVYKADYDIERDDLKNQLEEYADSIKDGIEVDLTNNYYDKSDIDSSFYSKSQIDEGFQVKGTYASEGYVDDSRDEAKDYADAEDLVLKGELETYANTAASNVGNSTLIAAKSYADTKLNDAKTYTDNEVFDLETTIADNYAEINQIPNLSDYALKSYVDSGLEGKQPAGTYVTDDDVDLYIEDYIDGEDFLTEANAEQMFLDKDLGDFMGQYVFGAESYPVLSNVYAPNIYPPVSSSSAPAGFSGFRFSAW